jgi:hypothetical protein
VSLATGDGADKRRLSLDYAVMLCAYRSMERSVSVRHPAAMYFSRAHAEWHAGMK